jgi:hypothetical protein
VSNGIDEDVSSRVNEEIKRFNDAFAAARQDNTPENLESLAEAADRPMRAIGRVLIEAKRWLGD